MKKFWNFTVQYRIHIQCKSTPLPYSTVETVAKESNHEDVKLLESNESMNLMSSNEATNSTISSESSEPFPEMSFQCNDDNHIMSIRTKPNRTNFHFCLLNDVVHMFTLIIVYLTNSLNWFDVWINAKTDRSKCDECEWALMKSIGCWESVCYIVHIQVNRLHYVSHPFHINIWVLRLLA